MGSFLPTSYGWLGAQALGVELTHDQAASLHEATKARVNDRLAIIINDEAVMMPKVRTPIPDGKLEITTNGNLTRLKKTLWPPAQNNPQR